MADDPQWRALSGRAYRHSAPAHDDIRETLAASERVGGRFNRRGDFGAVYASLERDTVHREFARHAERMGIGPEELSPRSLLVLTVDLQRVLDLTDPQVGDTWLVEVEDIKSDGWDHCQAVGQAARERGFEAILFPSATCSGTNVVIFLDRLDAGSDVGVVDQEPLELITARADEAD